MGKLTGPFSFKGRLGSVVGYDLGDKTVVRTIGSTQKTHQHPATQQAKVAFGVLSAQNKLLRDTLGPFLRQLERKKLDLPVSSLLRAVRDLDPRSKPERSLTGGLAVPGAIDLFNGFEFNHAPAHVRFLLHSDIEADTSCQTLTLRHFSPRVCLSGPASASHAALSSCVARIDFTQFTGAAVFSSSLMLDLASDDEQAIVLRPENTLSGDGIYLLLLKIVFFDRVNGIDYPLAGAANGCMVVKGFGGSFPDGTAMLRT